MNAVSSAKHGCALTLDPDQRTRREARALRVGGLTPLSTSDYPGQLAVVVFCQGCAWRCAYCHNPHLLPRHRANEIAWDDVLAFLRRRKGLLDAVVFSGGEPLAQPGLAAAMRSVRELGFRVGLHTAGAYPSRLAEVLPLVDWVGIDVKAPFAEYPLITAVLGSGDKALASTTLIIESGVAHEFRTTVHPAQIAPRTLFRLADSLAAIGAKHYALQEFRADGCASATLTRAAPPSFLSESYCAKIAPKFSSFVVRRTS